MVHIVRPIWENVGQDNQLGREFPRLTYTQADADGLMLLEDAPRTIRGARDLLSVGLQYGNAFGQGFQAAALKPADFFGNDDILYLMEDAATGEIRLSILWEWVHKKGRLTEDDAPIGAAPAMLSHPRCSAACLPKSTKSCCVPVTGTCTLCPSKRPLPITREIVERYVLDETKVPWYIDLLNINLNNHDLACARERIESYMRTFKADGTRITENLDTGGETHYEESTQIEQQVLETERWMDGPRFEGMTRLYGPRQVVEQRGTIPQQYTVAANAARDMYARLRELFQAGRSIVTFGPYSPGQAVVMKRVGIEGIYLGGWATSAKGSISEDPGADLASYPLSQVPDEAAPIVRALLTADKNQQFARSRMTEAERAATPKIDYRPFIIADADTGHGGDAHVRNLIRRFVEVGVPGYHIEDQKPGCKKCGHQGGKVLVPVDEQIKRLNAARFQLDVMGVPGIIVARTDAEAATLLDGKGDERDQPFILGATNLSVPSWKTAYLAILRRFHALGVTEINGHRLYKISDAAYQAAEAWLRQTGVWGLIEEVLAEHQGASILPVDSMLNQVSNRFVECWQSAAGLMTFGQAVAEVMAAKSSEGQMFDLTVDQWLNWSKQVGYQEAYARARGMGVDVTWDCELSRTPEGYYPIRGGIEYSIAKSLAVAPFADVIWMETATANLAYARTVCRGDSRGVPR